MFTVDVAKTKWKHLRDNFRAELKKNWEKEVWGCGRQSGMRIIMGMVQAYALFKRSNDWEKDAK